MKFHREGLPFYDWSVKWDKGIRLEKLRLIIVFIDIWHFIYEKYLKTKLKLRFGK